MKLVTVASVVLLLTAVGNAEDGGGASFNLTILHMNDVHARFDESTASGSLCKNSSATKCYGGVARRVTAIRLMRERYGPNVLLLDAGDQFQGTLWFYVYHGAAAVHFMNELKYDAMAIGNHEYDNGIAGLVPFLRNATFPVVCANIDASGEPTMRGLFRKSTVVVVGGQRIGIVGYTTKETPQLSETGRVKFEDEVAAVQTEVDRLQAVGVQKIIALGHAGFLTDKQIAAEVRGVDAVVGGHSNTFLYTGVPPAQEKPEGPYPFVVTQSSTGRQVPVVQAYAFGKYLGVLHLTFDDRGEVTHSTGNPLLLDSTIEQDATTLTEMIAWRAPIVQFSVSVVGSTQHTLDGRFESCRLQECTMGDVMADAMIDFYQQPESAHKDLHIAILNGGSIRASIEEGNITYGDVMETLPFGITIDIVELSGKDLLSVFEYSVIDYDPCNRRGKFLQVAGVRVTYDMQAPNGGRVRELIVRQSDGSDSPVEPETVYKVAASSYLIGGGDGYLMIRQLMRHHYDLGFVDVDIMVEYLKRNSPLSIQQQEGRIAFFPERPTTCAGA